MADINTNLSIFYQNTRGLRTKTNVFYRNVSVNSYDIILLTETWLLDSIKDSELFDDRYVVFRHDRDYLATQQKYGGGVLIATRKELITTPQPTFCSSAEDLWITLKVKGHGKTHTSLHICVLYLCSQKMGFSFSQQLSNFLDNLECVMNHNSEDKFLIVGDFNLSNISWTVGANSFCCPSFLNDSPTSDDRLLLDSLHLLGLDQFNYFKNKFGRILDLVLANDSFINITDCSCDPLVPIDDNHGALLISVSIQIYPPLIGTAGSSIFMYDQGDYENINKEIYNINWSKEFLNKSLDESLLYFYDVYVSLREKYIPCKLLRTDSYPKWYTKSLKKAIKEKFKYFHKYKVYGNIQDRNSFIFLRDRVRSLEDICYKKYIKLVEDSITTNPRYFWKYMNSKAKSNPIPSSLSFNNTSYSTGSSIVMAFSDYFKSTFLDDTSMNNTFRFNLDDSETSITSSSDISFVTVDKGEVTKLLLKLDPYKSCGPDYLPARFLINCAKSISEPLSILFQKSLDTGVVPLLWKRAFVVPIHKKGPKTSITNYRPISKLCIISKVLEKLVHSQVYSALRHSFHETQHGFLKGRSTVSNLVLLNDVLTEAMDDGAQVDVVYTDYSKAFDRIQHNMLLFKLSKMGIRGNLLRWFSSYISNRSQAVVVSNYVSGWVPIPSGVPQGSLLGPLLFVIFVNDINTCLQTSQLLCFADDMKIFARVSSVADAEALQSDLHRLEAYCAENMLDLNPTKCSIVSFSRKRSVLNYNYTLKGELLQRESSIRDLGVLHDSKLLFDAHIDAITAKAYKALGFVLRSSRDFTKAKTLKVLYCCYVRSNLEYASQVWNPRYNKYINRVEAIQKKFIRHLCFRIKEPYSSTNYLKKCKKHHLLPLEKRREIGDLVFLLKIASNAIDCPNLLSELYIRPPKKTLRNNALIHLPLATAKYRQNTFLWRACRNFNYLSEDLDLDLFNTGPEAARRLLSRRFFDNDVVNI